MPRSTSRPKTPAADGGRSGSKLTSTGSPQAKNAGELSEAEAETREQLYFRAAALGINGRSRMTKDALRDAIARREAEEASGRRR
ncbi:MAG: hypothetical protein AB7G21_01845 [Dehalococcoidia bacterium]